MIQEIKRWKITISFSRKSKEDIGDPSLNDFTFIIYDNHYSNMLRKLTEINFPFGMEVEKVTIEG